MFNIVIKRNILLESLNCFILPTVFNVIYVYVKYLRPLAQASGDKNI